MWKILEVEANRGAKKSLGEDINLVDNGITRDRELPRYPGARLETIR